MNDFNLRAPVTPSELARLRFLFGNVPPPPQAQLLAAVRHRPVERFVAALAGWTEGQFGVFRMACLPGVAREDVAGALIKEALVTARAAGLQKLMYADLLTGDSPWYSVLTANRYEIVRSERLFRIPASLAVQRVSQMMDKHREEIPADWHCESIRSYSPETILDLIAPFRLMTPEEIGRYWNSNAARSFEPDMSGILFEAQRAFGVLLIRRAGDALYYEVRVVNHQNVRLRSLANLCLLYHNLQKYDPSQPVNWLDFRGGELEHRETANLSYRMGGTEMPLRHVLARSVVET